MVKLAQLGEGDSLQCGQRSQASSGAFSPDGSNRKLDEEQCQSPF
ncbi:MAG: hypothetical protein Q4D37_05905 [Oscillospiraceae bacterium]|nr:hypothetical protein [Oscillospiraceae bacterium]